MLIDTSVLLRILQVHHPQHEIAKLAIQRMAARGTQLDVVPQVLVEIWVVATRPVEQNGLGMTPAAAGEELQRIKSMFVLLPETSAIYPTWEALVTQHSVSGKPSHDARLAAAMQVHGLTSIPTFDQTGFSRFSGISVVHPADTRGKMEGQEGAPESS